jgi:ATP-dependent Clp protease ATP-binding subunit ClpA
MEPIPRAVDVTRPAGTASGLARMEARRLGHQYLGPEHLLVGLLAQGDNLAARVLVANDLDLDTVRAGIDRLVAEGVLPGPQPSDAELLATLGIDPDAIMDRLRESFGWEAYYDAAQDVQYRPRQPFPHAPGAGTPLVCWRVFTLVAREAEARGEDATPLHWLLALLRDAEDPIEVLLDQYPMHRRLRAMYCLPEAGPSPVRLLVEAHGLTLEGLRSAVLAELDRDH